MLKFKNPSRSETDDPLGFLLLFWKERRKKEKKRKKLLIYTVNI